MAVVRSVRPVHSARPVRAVCPVCGHAGVTSADLSLPLFSCAVCSHMFSVVTKKSQEKYSEEYYLAEHANWFAHPNFPYFRRVLGMINQRVLGGVETRGDGRFDLLDVGCGKGDFLKYLSSVNPEAGFFGIDITSNTDSRIRFVSGDFMSYSFGRCFDVVTAFMVIEHVDDPRSFVARVHELVRPGGWFVCSTINNDSVMYWLARVLRRVGLRDSFDRLYSTHHLQHFSNASLRRLLLQGGFSVELMSNHNYPMGAVDVPQNGVLPAWLYRWAVRCIFGVSWLVGAGMHQTVVCKREK